MQDALREGRQWLMHGPHERDAAAPAHELASSWSPVVANRTAIGAERIGKLLDRAQGPADVAGEEATGG